jgi:hypothetical protein
MGEVCYQTILQGFNASIAKESKKRIFIPYGFKIGHYFIKDTRQARKEALNHLEYRFHTGRFRRHNPKGLVLQHVEKVFI